MRDEPYQDEYDAVPTMNDTELLEYFLYRIVEMDEVWGLKNGPHWLNREIAGQKTQPVWPLKRYAADAAVADWQNFTVVPDSLEFFIYQQLNKLAIQGVMIEIMPRKSGIGCLISPQRLFGFLEGMRDASECMVGD